MHITSHEYFKRVDVSELQLLYLYNESPQFDIKKRKYPVVEMTRNLSY